MSLAGDPPATEVLDTGAAGGRAIRGGALRTGAYVTGMLLSLISVPLMVRHLGVADYGYYMTVLSIVFIIGGVTEAGLTYFGTREYSVLDGSERDRFLQNLTGLRFVLTGIGVGAATLLTLVTGARAVVVQGTLITGLALLISLSQQTYAIPLMAKLRLGSVAALDLVRQALLTGLIVACVIVGAGLLPFFAASIGSALGALIATLLLVRREGSLRPRFDQAVWTNALRHVLPYAAATAVGLIYFRLAVIVMSYVASAEETGIYSAAFRIVEVGAAIPWLVVSSGFPILARAADRDDERLRYSLQRLFDVSIIVGVWLALGVGLGAAFAIDVVAGSRFEAAVSVLRLLGLAMVTSFLVATWAFALLSLKAYGDLLRANVAAAVVACVGVLAFEPVWGARGAAVATVAAEAVLAVGYLRGVRRVRRDLTPSFWVLPKVLIAAAAGATAATLPLGPVAAAVIGGAIYFVVLVALRGVPPEIRAALFPR